MSTPKLSAALKTGKGRIRTNNEDAYYFNGYFAEIHDMDQETSLSSVFSGGECLFAICDGMGGHENGEVASFTAVSSMPRLQRALLSADFPATISNWAQETNAAILSAARDGGCTLALLYIKGETIHIAHIGDSRIYRYHDGKLVRVTKDHSKLQVLLDAGLITEKDAENHPHRHVVTRAFGMNEEETGKCTPTIHAPLFTENNDWYIICSDGVTDMLPDNRIQDILAQSRAPVDCAERIYGAAIDAGGRDNTSVIVLRIESGRQNNGLLCDEEDPYETTLNPAMEAPVPIHIQQETTITQTDGQTITIKTQISGSQLSKMLSRC